MEEVGRRFDMGGMASVPIELRETPGMTEVDPKNDLIAFTGFDFGQ